MKKLLRICLWVVGGFAAACVAIVVLALIFGEDGGSSPITTFSVNDKKVLVFTPGIGEKTLITTSSASEGQVTVRNRKIALRRDGSVLVDDKKLELGTFTELEVRVYPDQRVETRITRGGG